MASVLVACDPDPLPPPEGPHYQYVVSELYIPATNTDARQFGLDLNGDLTVDNQLGMVFSTLHNNGLGVGDTAHEALLRGGLIMLADLQTLAFDATESSGVTMYLGTDPVPAPCLDPGRLETCGQHLLGSGQFAVDGSSTSDLAIAPIEDGRFLASMSQLSVQLALDPTAPLRVDLHGARIRLTSITPEHAVATLAGGITTSDVNDVIIPEAAAQMERIVVAECGQPLSTLCGCPGDSRGRLLQGLFDRDQDCRITTEEVVTNSLVVSLVAPDVTIDGEHLLSFGVGVELASATFPPPGP